MMKRALTTLVVAVWLVFAGATWLMATWTNPRTWTSGHVVTAAELNTELRDNLNALIPITSTITTTGTQTALSLPAGRNNLVIFANNASLLTIQGIAAGSDGQRLTIYAIGAGQVALVHQSGSASASNRLVNIATSGNSVLAAGAGHASYLYDTTATRWRLEEFDQGAWITPTFSAGDFTGNTASWTVGSGDVSTSKYWLKGRTLHYAGTFVTTTVSNGATSMNISNAQWGGFTSAATIVGFSLYNDNGAGNAAGFYQVNASGTAIIFGARYSGAYAAATDSTSIFIDATFEVQ